MTVFWSIVCLVYYFGFRVSTDTLPAMIQDAKKFSKIITDGVISLRESKKRKIGDHCADTIELSEHWADLQSMNKNSP